MEHCTNTESLLCNIEAILLLSRVECLPYTLGVSTIERRLGGKVRGGEEANREGHYFNQPSSVSKLLFEPRIFLAI